MNRGDLYTTLGRHEEALADYDRSIELDPTKCHVYKQRGASYRNLGRYEEALADYDRSIELDPTQSSTYHHRAFAHSGLGHHNEALADFDETIRLAPEPSPDMYECRGDSYATLGRHEEALADYDRSIELDPTHWHVYKQRGASYTTLGRHEEALADYDRSIELDPTQWYVYKRRGSAHFELGYYDEALADISKAVELRPDDVSNVSWIPLQLVAKCPNERFRLGIFELADKTVQLNQGVSEAYCIRGKLHAALGHREEALADFDKARQLDPNYSWLLPQEYPEAYAIHFGLLQPDEERRNQAIVHLRQHPQSGDQIAPAWLDWVSRWLPAMLPGTDSLPGIVFVSDMPWVRSTCGWNALLGWGPEEALRDRIPQPELGSISIAGLPYSKGVWNQSFEDERPADVVLDISGHQFVSFKAHVGLGNKGSVQFQVLVDGDLKHETPIVRLGTLQAICVDVAGAKEVVLRVLNGGDGAGYDCVLWGFARFVQAGAEDPLEVPSAKLQSATEANAAFFLAEVHWRLDQKDLARRWYDKAVEWMDKNRPDDEDLRRYRAEAAEVLGISEEASTGKEKPT